ncbi:ferredoxin--NADP reductase [Desulfococcus sp.]|uniref:ferredoxin--NADP reductase n=1 Tax=Desulfococcus sp. TaxID=2025834 RepID=UPI003593E7F5
MPELVPRPFAAAIAGRRSLSRDTFELRLNRPPDFSFTPGQFIRLIAAGEAGVVQERDYSLISIPSDPEIGLLIRDTGTGRFSSFLGAAEPGTLLQFTGPHGYFTYRETGRPAVFVATGTGLAPFVSMARSGVTGFLLLHGVRAASDLYYESLFRNHPCRYVPCLSGGGTVDACPEAFHGRVTAYMEDRLLSGEYDFYLCGRGEMIREATLLIDDRFPGSRVYSEMFY